MTGRLPVRDPNQFLPSISDKKPPASIVSVVHSPPEVAPFAARTVTKREMAENEKGLSAVVNDASEESESESEEESFEEYSSAEEEAAATASTAATAEESAPVPPVSN